MLIASHTRFNWTPTTTEREENERTRKKNDTQTHTAIEGKHNSKFFFFHTLRSIQNTHKTLRKSKRKMVFFLFFSSVRFPLELKTFFPFHWSFAAIRFVFFWVFRFSLCSIDDFPIDSLHFFPFRCGFWWRNNFFFRICFMVSPYSGYFVLIV